MQKIILIHLNQHTPTNYTGSEGIYGQQNNLDPLILHQQASSTSNQLDMDEALGLCEALNLQVLESFDFKIKNPNPSFYMGKGQLQIVSDFINSSQEKPQAIVVNALINPLVQRNLQRQFKLEIIDRSLLILQIFKSRALSMEGKLQVDLAMLMYQKSRLVKAWDHLERQKGGTSKTGGPGEKQMELDRRMLMDKIVTLKTELQQVKKNRQIQRSRRSNYKLVSLVGYTNAGKSSLFNCLNSQNKVLCKDMPFSTLDTKVTLMDGPKNGLDLKNVMLADTVGFIKQIPTQLIDAFCATLEETQQANLILHVVNASDFNLFMHLQEVFKTLEKIKAQAPCIILLNKADKLSEEEASNVLNKVRAQYGLECMLTSIYNPTSIQNLKHTIIEKLSSNFKQLRVSFNLQYAHLLDWFYKNSQIISKHVDEQRCTLNLRIQPSMVQIIEQNINIKII